MVKMLSALLTVALSLSVNAGELEIQTGTTLVHLSSGDYNEDNEVLAVNYRFDYSDYGVMGTTFINSFGNRTTGIGVSKMLWYNGTFKVDLLVVL